MTLYEAISPVPANASDHNPMPFLMNRGAYSPHSYFNRTIMAGGGDYDIHPSGERPFTLRELACIQTFPVDYQFHGLLGEKKRQIGNAVPPILGKAVLEAVKGWMERSDEMRKNGGEGRGRQGGLSQDAEARASAGGEAQDEEVIIIGNGAENRTDKGKGKEREVLDDVEVVEGRGGEVEVEGRGGEVEAEIEVLHHFIRVVDTEAEVVEPVARAVEAEDGDEDTIMVIANPAEFGTGRNKGKEKEQAVVVVVEEVEEDEDIIMTTAEPTETPSRRDKGKGKEISVVAVVEEANLAVSPSPPANIEAEDDIQIIDHRTQITHLPPQWQLRRSEAPEPIDLLEELDGYEDDEEWEAYWGGEAVLNRGEGDTEAIEAQLRNDHGSQQGQEVVLIDADIEIVEAQPQHDRGRHQGQEIVLLDDEEVGREGLIGDYAYDLMDEDKEFEVLPQVDEEDEVFEIWSPPAQGSSRDVGIIIE